MSTLAKVSIFEKLTRDELAKLEKVVVREHYRADTAVFFEGDASDSLYIIQAGKVKVARRSNDGRDQILGTLREGAIFGEMAMFDGAPRSATVTTLAPTTLLSISRRDFRAFVDARPDVLWRVIESLCRHLRRAGSEILDLSFRDPRYRLLTRIEELVERDSEETPDGARITVRLTPDDLAGMVGASQERVSRLLDNFEDNGLVSWEGDSLIVRDKRALRYAILQAQE